MINNFGYIKVKAVSPRVYLGDIQKNADTILSIIQSSEEQALVFPALALSGASLEDLYFQPVLHKACLLQLERICKESAHKNALIVIGLPLAVQNRVYEAAACIYQGKVQCFVAKTKLTAQSARTFTPLTEACSVHFAGESIAVLPYASISIANYSVLVSLDVEHLYRVPAQLVLLPMADPCYTGAQKDSLTTLGYLSKSNTCAIAYANAGFGESSSYQLFNGFCAIVENGEILAKNNAFAMESTHIISEIDLEAMQFMQRKAKLCSCPCDVALPMELAKTTQLLRKYTTMPYLQNADDVEEILQMQMQALITRLKAIHCDKVVIGLSGGLDSAVCLLATYLAFQKMNLPTQNIHVISMPGFGTGKTTKSNADMLMDMLAIHGQTISIVDSVNQHFKDIEHDSNKHDVTYENAQARERTQILMDIANKIGGIVLGTGDMSEIALGFCTYNGDHMSMYNMNAGIVKTVLRPLLVHMAQKISTKLTEVCKRIVNTPVSPELLPSAEAELSQATEAILGSYELHDFYLYHFMQHGYSKEKMQFVAEQSFDNFSKQEIARSLDIFCKRFFSQQFKRNCSTDGIGVAEFSLSPHKAFVMPSDVISTLWK
ncbi:MAG: NAD(+) synthase [Eubacteriales bacterium]|nr:NAD(+) synthase [Eubacteriales bacterium]